MLSDYSQHTHPTSFLLALFPAWAIVEIDISSCFVKILNSCWGISTYCVYQRVAAKAFPSLSHNLSKQLGFQRNTKQHRKNNDVKNYFNQDYVKIY